MFKFPLSVILALVMCFSANLSKAADEIVIGLSMVKTGFLKTPAEATETAVDIAVSEINASGGINGKKIRLVKYDTESKAKLAVVATQKFARDDGALAIIGPFSSGEAKAAFPVGERLGIVQIPNASSGPGLTKGYTYAWRLTEMEGVQFARVLKTLKKKKIDISKAEIVYISDEYVSSLVGKFVYPALFKTFNLPGMDEVNITPPNVIYETGMHIWLGGYHLQLLYHGRGHTDGDTIIYMPRLRTVISGDIVFNKKIPYMNDSYIDEWIESLDYIELLKNETVIPGHGEVGGRPLVIGMKHYLLDLKRLVTTQLKDKKTNLKSSLRIAPRVTLQWTSIRLRNRLLRPPAELKMR